MSISLRRATASALALVGAALAAPAQAQSGAPSPVSFPTLSGPFALKSPGPGELAAGFGASAIFVRMPLFRYGENYANSGFHPSLGPYFDLRSHRTGAMPEFEAAYGLPGGLFGAPAEIFANFAFYKVTARARTIVERTGAPSWVFPFVGRINLPVSGLSLTGLDPGIPFTFDIQRWLASYDGAIGLRLRHQVGPWTLTPAVQFGFHRLSQEHRINLSFLHFASTVPGGGPTQANLDGDAFRFGGSLAASRSFAPGWTWYGAVSGSLDIVRARLSASSSFTRFDGMLNFLETGSVSVSDRRSVVSGRVAARTGIAFAPIDSVTIALFGGFHFMGAVPYVVYPTHPTYNAGTHNNASGPARIGFESQLGYNVGLGVTVRF